MSDGLTSFPPRFLRTPEAARFLGLSGRTLEKHRTYGTGPKYRKLGGRVIYALDDLKAWADLGVKTSTADPGVGTVLPAGRRRVTLNLTLIVVDGRASSTMANERQRLMMGERATLDPFIALPDDGVSPRDQRDLMERPFFSLAKSKRTKPILYKAGNTEVQVYALQEYGMATIWDADVLIWAATQIVEAADQGLHTSRFFRFTPYQLLVATGKGTGFRQYKLLKGALQRLQSTVVLTTIRQGENWRRQQFSWLNEWEELIDVKGRCQGMEFVLPEWFYQGVLDRRLVLTIDPAYFRLTGGIERWLCRVARKHAGRQPNGWAFDVKHLHAKSGSLARVSDFALDLRRIAARQSLPGYRLTFEWEDGKDLLRFTPGNLTRLSTPPVDNPVQGLGTSGARGIGTSGARLSVRQAQGLRKSLRPAAETGGRNFSNFRESNFCFRDGEKAFRGQFPLKPITGR